MRVESLGLSAGGLRAEGFEIEMEETEKSMEEGWQVD